MNVNDDATCDARYKVNSGHTCNYALGCTFKLDSKMYSVLVLHITNIPIMK